jgi:hypothetical protein
MLSKQEEEAERREVLENDRRVREQQQQRGTTFHQYAQAAANDDAGGRWATVNAVSVVGAEPAVKYPAAAAHQRDPVPTEPPLGYCVDEMAPLEPSTVSSSFPVEDTGAPAGAAHTADNLPPSAESDDTGAPFSPTEGSK